MKLHIPSIGDKLILSKDWSFKVHKEYRNRGLLEVLNPEENLYRSGVNNYGQPVADCVLPAGIELTVDRIYIRKGVKEFDSITFRAKDPNKKNSKSYRFWVKLEEANRIEYEENVSVAAN